MPYARCNPGSRYRTSGSHHMRYFNFGSRDIKQYIGDMSKYSVFISYQPTLQNDIVG